MALYARRNLPTIRRYAAPVLSTPGAAQSIFDEFDRMMGNMLRSAGDDDGDGQRLSQFAFSPSVDFHEDEDRYELSVEIAGMKRDDIDVSVEDGALIVSGEKMSTRGSGERDADKGSDQESEDGDGNDSGGGQRPSGGSRQHLSERTYGRFERRMRLPDNADTQDISASFADGVLTLDIPKKEDEKPERQKIEIS